MSKEAILKLITSPITEEYFPEIFLKECKSFKKINYVGPIKSTNETIYRFEHIVPEEWHNWLENYIKLRTDGFFPFLWPFLQDDIGFEFHVHLDDFENAEDFFSLGNDPSGDWFVMTKKTGSKVHLCDQHDYGVYDGWINPNHLVAWASRSALADEHELTKEEILEYWEVQAEKIERETIEKIVSELN